MKLSEKLITILISLVGVMAALFTAASILVTQSALQSNIEDNQLFLAEIIMNKIDRTLYGRLADVQTIAQADPIEHPLILRAEQAPQEKIQESDIIALNRLHEFLLRTGPWDVLRVADTEGRIILSTDKQESENSMRENNASKIAFDAALQGKVYFSDVLRSEIARRPTIIYASPIHNQDMPGKPVVGVVMGEFAWPVIEEILQESKVEAHLYNNEGFLIAGSDASEREDILREKITGAIPLQQAANPTSGSLLLPTASNPDDHHDTGKVLTSYISEQGYLRYTGNGWVLLLETPSSIAFAPVKNLTRTLFLIGLGILFILIPIALIFSRSISKPILTLKDVADKISKGNLAEPIEVSGKDEISELAESFDNMRYSLKLVIDEYEGLKGKEEVFSKLQKEVNVRKQAEERFRRLIDTASDAIMTIAPPTWRFTSANNAALKMFGAKQEKEFITKAPWDVSPKKQPDNQLSSEKAKSMFLKAMKQGSHRFEWTYTRLDGKEFPSTVVLSRFTFERKKMLHVTLRDVSQERKSLHDLMLFRQLLDATSDSIFLIDAASGRCIDVNKAAERNTGYSRKELLSMKVMDLEAVIPSQSVWKRYISKVKKLGKIRTEGRHRKKDKTTFPVEVNLSYTELNHKPYVVATVRNIAERKDAESKIKTLAKFPEANLNLVLKLDAQGNVEYANPAAIDAAKRLQVGIMRVLPKEHKKIAAKVVGSDKTISKVSSVKGHSFDFVFKSFKNVQAVFVTGIQRRRKQDKASEKIFRKLSSKYKDMPTKEELEEVFGKR